jgi:hypothetical protein
MNAASENQLDQDLYPEQQQASEGPDGGSQSVETDTKATADFAFNLVNAVRSHIMRWLMLSLRQMN